MAIIVTPGFASNVTVKHFLLETSTIKIFIPSSKTNSEMNESSVGKYSNYNSIPTLNPPTNFNYYLTSLMN